MAKWVLVDDHVKEIKAEPWSLYWREWSSSSTEFQDFLVDPLKTIIADKIKGVSQTWSVNTEVLNHAIPLKMREVCLLMIVMPKEKRIKLLLYKHEPS